MNDDIKAVIEEKFTRCPRCRSFSVRQTDELTLDERIKARLVSAVAFKCDNCSYRFVEFGKFSDTVKEVSRSFYGRVERKWLFAVIPLVVLGVIVTAFLLMSGNNLPHGKQVKPGQGVQQVQHRQDNKVTGQKTEQVAQNVTGDNKDPAKQGPVTTDVNVNNREEPKQEETKEPVYDIVLGNSNRFGVNWVTVANGVRIARMSNGPLEDAGLLIGDIFSEVDNQKITNGNSLLKIRDEIYSGRKSEVLIKVYRDGKLFLFRMVKNKDDANRAENLEKKPEEKQEEKQEVKKESPPPAAIQNAAQNENVISGSIKVFSQAYAKVRSSARDNVGQANEWKYARKTLSIRREANQRVFLAGDAGGLRKWAVDDEISINGKSFTGVTGDDYTPESSLIPDGVKVMPIDITDLVPAGQGVQLNIILSDHGKYWGNTDIYIVIK
jgi:hypothetical protein